MTGKQEDSLPALALASGGAGARSGPEETSEAARPAEPLRRRTIMRDRLLALFLPP
jgi:hypothetical protein